MAIGNQIKQAREQKRMSQNELAKRAGLAQSTLSYIESGEKSPTMDTLQAIAVALGYDQVSAFLGQEEPRPSVIRDEELKFALFGDPHIDDDIMEDVRRYAQFIKARKEQEKG